MESEQTTIQLFLGESNFFQSSSGSNVRASLRSLHHNSRACWSPCRKAVATSAHKNSHWFKTPRDSSTCLDVLFKVGELVSRVPDSRLGSEFPCSTSLALAFVPPLPSSAHLRTKRAFNMRLSDAFSGSSSSCQTPFSKIDCSSAFFPVMNVRRSSTVMRDSFKSPSLSFFFFRGRVAAIQTSEGEFSMEPEVNLLIFFLKFMHGILSFCAASLVRGNNIFANLSLGSSYRVNHPSWGTFTQCDFQGLQVSQFNGDIFDGISSWSPWGVTCNDMISDQETFFNWPKVFGLAKDKWVGDFIIGPAIRQHVTCKHVVLTTGTVETNFDTVFLSQAISPWSMLRRLCWKLVLPLSAGKVLTAAAGWSSLAGKVLTATFGPFWTSESSLGTGGRSSSAGISFCGSAVVFPSLLLVLVLGSSFSAITVSAGVVGAYENGESGGCSSWSIWRSICSIASWNSSASAGLSKIPTPGSVATSSAIGPGDSGGAGPCNWSWCGGVPCLRCLRLSSKSKSASSSSNSSIDILLVLCRSIRRTTRRCRTWRMASTGEKIRPSASTKRFTWCFPARISTLPWASQYVSTLPVSGSRWTATTTAGPFHLMVWKRSVDSRQ